MNKSMNLYLLQQTDLKLDQYNHRIQEIQSIIADLTERDQLTREIETIRTNRLEIEKKLHNIEDKIKSTRIKMQQSEGSLYGGKIQNPKELQDLQTEIGILKKQIAELEEREFEQMVLTEDIITQENDAVHRLEFFDQKKEEEKLILTAEIKNLEQAISRVTPEKSALTTGLDQISLDIYLKLRKTKSGIAVTQVEENACEKCGAEITQAEWQKARITQELCFCSTCGRIIYGK
jgi:predicted  nucleic acid-binding Zn-ribbon protein